MLEQVSSRYRSAPLDAEGPDFLNAVARVRTGLAPLGSGGAGNLLVDAVAAAVSQAVTSNADLAHGVSRNANTLLFMTKSRELPPGPYRPAPWSAGR